MNEGIALLTLQKLDDAKKALQRGSRSGAEHAAGVVQPGLGAACGERSGGGVGQLSTGGELDPRDADSYYFEGACYQELKQFDKAIAIFEEALRDQSAARVGGVCSGAGAATHRAYGGGASDHFKRFQHLTSTKISAAIGLAYGEQGHYSTVMPVKGAGDDERRR